MNAGNKRRNQPPIFGLPSRRTLLSMGVIESLYFAALYRIPYHW
jgi:hypothetical protein